MNAGEGDSGKESAAVTAALGESLCCCESDELPPEPFCDGVAALLARSWAPGVLTGAFPGCWEAGLLFVGTAKLFSAVDIVRRLTVCVFAVAGVAGTLLGVPSA